MTKPRALLLDFNGTLFEEAPPRHVIYATAARARGLAIDDATMQQTMRAAHDALPRTIDGHFRYTEHWFRAFIDAVFSQLRFAGDLDALAAELLATFARKETFRPFPEARAVVKRFKGARVPLAVVSNWGPRLPAILSLHGLADFDAVVASALVRMEKPEPGIFRRAAELLGVEPADCVHVGDHPVNDVAGAEAAGMTGILIDRTAGAGGDSIRTLSEVLPRFGLKTL